jgi:hypothetical protein
MTPEEAQVKMSEWKVIEGTSVWADLVEGLKVLGKMHQNTLERSEDDRKMYRAQGSLQIIRTVLDARGNQIRELTDIIEGRSKRTTAQAARFNN